MSIRARFRAHIMLIAILEQLPVPFLPLPRLCRGECKCLALWINRKQQYRHDEELCMIRIDYNFLGLDAVFPGQQDVDHAGFEGF